MESCVQCLVKYRKKVLETYISTVDPQSQLTALCRSLASHDADSAILVSGDAKSGLRAGTSSFRHHNFQSILYRDTAEVPTPPVLEVNITHPVYPQLGQNTQIKSLLGFPRSPPAWAEIREEGESVQEFFNRYIEEYNISLKTQPNMRLHQDKNIAQERPTCLQHLKTPTPIQKMTTILTSPLVFNATRPIAISHT
ncbi:hypothetical protein J6590_082152 [Homalodisca vitripennis]|nr:hypothetical protein J6590_082152 [Homalodisca vitripennis]